VVNLRTLAGIDDRATVPDTLTPQFEALAELQQQGLIRHLGLSTVSLDQLAEAQQIAPVVCVQNSYNIPNRKDASVLAATAEQHIAYVPSSRSAASRRCSRTCWSRSPSGSARPRWRSPSPGCCSTRRTSC
jgi:aryl-alcohol dehydrogenase-like predicted oxidoreductase